MGNVLVSAHAETNTTATEAPTAKKLAFMVSPQSKVSHLDRAGTSFIHGWLSRHEQSCLWRNNRVLLLRKLRGQLCRRTERRFTRNR